MAEPLDGISLKSSVSDQVGAKLRYATIGRKTTIWRQELTTKASPRRRLLIHSSAAP